MKIVHVTAWGLLLLQLSFFAVFCWPHGPLDTRFRIAWQARIEQEDAAEARSDAVRAEIAALGDHDWAGVYRPDFNGWDGPILELAPENGLVAWNGRTCGLDWIENHGEVTSVEEDRIGLALAINPSLERTEWSLARRPLLDSVLVRIRWCDRRYLVAESQMLQFCNDVNLLGDGAWVAFVRDVRDAHGVQRIPPVSGLPEVPEAWRPYLLDHVVEARLVSLDSPAIVAGVSWIDPPSRLLGRADRGRASGLLPGMILHWKHGDNSGSFEITSVEPDSCTLESHGGAATHATDLIPTLGTRLVSGLRDMHRAGR